MNKIVDGVELLRMIKENKFEDGVEIRAKVTTNQIYVYSAYYRNFTHKKTGNQLKAQEYVFWDFEILSEEKEEEIDIQAIEEDRVTCEINNLDNAKFVIRKNEDNIAMLIKAVKQLDKKVKEK